MLVAITGATGFVGQHLLGTFAQRDWKLRLLLRRWSPLPSLAGIAAEIVWGDLGDERALRSLVDGADAVVHLAGLIKARHDREFWTVNRDGTARLAALAPEALFLLLSSLAAREPQLSAYAASKRAAEDAVASRQGRWIVVRAPAIYGPGDRETLTYFQAVRRGFALEPRVSAARLALIHVDDLVRALALCLEKPPPPAVYEIDDGREGGYRYADMAAAVSKALGGRAWTLRIPRGVMAAVAAANRLGQGLGGPVQILGAGKVSEIFHSDWAVHDRRLAEAVDFLPRYALEEGFRDTISWYREHGWL